MNRRIAKTEISVDDVFPFLQWRCGDRSVDGAQFAAKPSEVLFVLLYHFFARNQLETIRYDFEKIDRTLVSTFVPKCYNVFTEKLIYDGANVHFQVGFDVFTANEFSSFVERYLRPSVREASRGMEKLQFDTALLATLIYPDRVPSLLAKAIVQER